MIYLICGVPGSGKTWVLNHFRDTHHVLHYDHHFNTPRAQYALKLVNAARDAPGQPILADSPLGISEIINTIKSNYQAITLLFILEAPEVVARRYEQREGKPIPKQHLGRIATILKRSREYNGFVGTSEQVYQELKRLLKGE